MVCNAMRLCISLALASGAHAAPVSEEDGGVAVNELNMTSDALLPGRAPPAIDKDHRAPSRSPFAQTGIARHSRTLREKKGGHGNATDPFECLLARNGDVECIPYINYEQRSSLEKRRAVALKHKVYSASRDPLSRCSSTAH
jgi:hypothetical protein